jgi:two-component system sporulation sensor kinase B
MMEIYSVKNQGTTVFLFFPRRRVARAGRAEAH